MPAGPLLQFGPFELDAANARLLRQGQPLDLPPRSFDLLRHLAERPGQLVTKDELLDAVWQRRFITEAVIKTAVSELRAALDDDAREPRYIETVPRRGYRFIAAVATGAPAPAAAAALPAEATPLVGREAELALALDCLERGRFLTITGPGGVGKTRLALALARRLAGNLPDGARLVELAPLSAEAGAEVLRAAIAQCAGLGAGAAASDAALVRALGASRMLLLLDNAEHVMPRLTPLLAALRDAAGGVSLLLTSQEPTAIQGEQLLRLAPLALPDAGARSADELLASAATRLFVQRVADRLPGFAPDAAQLAAIAAICRQLDGLPLALELAAARVPLLGVHGLHERLLDGEAAALALLTRGPRDAAPRQRTLRAALAWSHGLLNAVEQAVFRRLAVFRGGFEADLAVEVCSDGLDADEVLDALDSLLDKSLLVVADAGSARRLALLDMPRAFAAEQLAASGEGAALARRHAQAVHRLLQRRAAQWLDEPTFAWQQRVLPELANLRAAVAHAGKDPPAAALRVGLAAWGATLWLAAAVPREAVQAIEAVADDLPQAAPADIARYWHAQAQLATAMVLPPARGLQAAVQALDLYRARGDVTGCYWALNYRITLSQWSSEPFDTAAALAEMRALEAPDWPPLRQRPRRFAEALQLMMAGHWRECRDAFADEHRRCSAAGDWRSAWLAGTNVAHAHLVLDEPGAALALAAEIAGQARAQGRLRQLWAPLAMQGIAALQLGDLPGAEAVMRELFDILWADGSLWWGADYWPALLLLRGRPEDAARLCALADRHVPGPRGALAAKVRDRVLQALHGQLGPERVARCREDAAGWGDEDLRRCVHAPAG